jgi:hypothetical protein
VIERDLPGAGQLSADQLRGIAQKSCEVLHELGPAVQWVQSYVTDDRLYCIYIASGEDLIMEHARRGGFPADNIARIRTVIDPATAE